MGVELSFAERRFLRENMQLILVGPDASGKTTLAEKLADYFDMEYVKGLRIPGRMEMCAEVLRQLLVTNMYHGVVRDRWQFPDDIIYEMAHGRPSSPLLNYIDLISHLMHKNNYIIVYVTAREDVLLQRFRSRGDELIDEAGMLKAARAYERFFKRHNELPFIKVHSTDRDPEELLDHAVKQLVKYNRDKGIEHIE